jgi:stage II sporulation protein D
MRAVASLAFVVLGCATAAALPPPAVVVVAAAPDAGAAVAKKDAAPAPLPLPAEIAGPALRRLDFKGGDPVVPVRLMEGQSQVTFGSAGRLKLSLSGKIPKTVEGPAGSVFTVKLEKGSPARVLARIQIVELPFADKEGVEAARDEWAHKGIALKPQVLGSQYGIAGKVIDNRRYLLLVDAPPAPPETLVERQAEILKLHGVRTSLFEELAQPGRATMGLYDASGAPIATAEDRLTVESPEGAPIDVKRVEYGVGYDFHNFEDRTFRGAVHFLADRGGKLATVNMVPMEQLLRGLVPAEIFARAHPEALKAQAVTARSEVLAKIGLKHLADPYLLCAEQHCAVYKGLASEAASTDLAVQATRGEGLFSATGMLVDATYSAVCGGHTEHNDIVWGGPPNPSLRGVPDLLPGSPPGVSPKKLTEFLTTEAQHACRVSSFAQPTKYRWEKKLSAEDVNARTASLGVGQVMAMSVTERGVSGRARLLQISGSEGATQVRGELTIRKLFGMLNSAMFELKVDKDPKGRPKTWIFTGGGWGHGVGMCQTGAIGRAEAGQGYREILGHYYSSAQVARIY